MKNTDQKQVTAYLELLNDVFKPNISNGILRVAKQINNKHGITATFRYLTSQCNLPIKQAHEIIKNI